MSINFNFLEELPQDWKTARVKNILDYNHHYPIGDGDHGSIKPEMYQDEGIPYLRVQNLSWGFDINYDNLVYISNEINQANGKSILIPKDILIAKTGATVGKMAIVPESMKQANTTSSVGKVTINHNQFNHKYFAYLFSSSMFQEQIKEKAYQKSAQPGFNIDDLVEFTIIIPPIDIQNKIASYLDKKTTKIDAIIAKNEELIRLLEEKRVALINQVVTKGLNPDVAMKDSGVDIIGNVPSNNNIVRLKFLCDIKTGDKDTVNRNPDGQYPFYVRSPIVERIDTYSFDGEAVLMAGDGVGAGKVFHYATGKFDYHQRVYNLHNFKHVLPKFIYYYMSSLFSIEIEKGSAKSTVDSVRLPMLEDFLISFPSIEEQQEIIDYLDHEITKINETLTKVTENINLLEEYKTSLIHHVVTGKIDVRGEEI